MAFELEKVLEDEFFLSSITVKANNGRRKQERNDG